MPLFSEVSLLIASVGPPSISSYMDVYFRRIIVYSRKRSGHCCCCMLHSPRDSHFVHSVSPNTTALIISLRTRIMRGRTGVIFHLYFFFMIGFTAIVNYSLCDFSQGIMNAEERTTIVRALSTTARNTVPAETTTTTTSDSSFDSSFRSGKDSSKSIPSSACFSADAPPTSSLDHPNGSNNFDDSDHLLADSREDFGQENVYSSKEEFDNANLFPNYEFDPPVVAAVAEEARPASTTMCLDWNYYYYFYTGIHGSSNNHHFPISIFSIDMILSIGIASTAMFSFLLGL
jgi:hypothetical protein